MVLPKVSVWTMWNFFDTNEVPNYCYMQLYLSFNVDTKPWASEQDGYSIGSEQDIESAGSVECWAASVSVETTGYRRPDSVYRFEAVYWTSHAGCLSKHHPGESEAELPPPVVRSNQVWVLCYSFGPSFSMLIQQLTFVNSFQLFDCCAVVLLMAMCHLLHRMIFL